MFKKIKSIIMDILRQYEPAGSLDFIALGYSESGKTYSIGSLCEMRYHENPPHRLNITGANSTSLSRPEEIYNVISHKKKDGVITATEKIDKAELHFQRKMTKLFSVNITDIMGQSTQKGRNIEEANKLLETIPTQHGVLLFIKVPTNRVQLFEAIGQLTDLLELLKKILQRNRRIPIALLITQIDSLGALTNIEDDIETEISEYIGRRQADGVSDMEIDMELSGVRRDILNSYVGKAIDTPYVKQLIEHFYNMLEGYKVKARAFPATSLGFDNTTHNLSRTLVAKNGLKPYGTIAAFLWMIYQYGRLNPNWTSGLRNYKESEVKEELLYLFDTGRAYEDPTDPRLNRRNITD